MFIFQEIIQNDPGNPSYKFIDLCAEIINGDDGTFIAYIPQLEEPRYYNDQAEKAKHSSILMEARMSNIPDANAAMNVINAPLMKQIQFILD